MDKLQAINMMLRSVQAMDITNLTAPDLSYEAQVAIDTFDFVNKQIQQDGYSFNTYIKTFVPDTSNFIILPVNILKADAIDINKNVVIKNNQLYDLDNNTFIFTEPIDLRYVLEIDFQELPIVAQNLIIIVATRRFQELIVGSELLNRFALQDERDARIQLKVYESKQKDANVLKNTNLYKILKR